MHENDLEASQIPGWSMLNDQSKMEYLQLQKSINKVINQSGKSKFNQIFDEVTQLIEEYIKFDTSPNHPRSLVCGYLHIDNALAINTRNLMKLIGKCKSSINMGFQAIGYRVIETEAVHASSLMKNFPFMKSQITMTRQWTIRSKIANASKDKQCNIREDSSQCCSEEMSSSSAYETPISNTIPEERAQIVGELSYDSPDSDTLFNFFEENDLFDEFDNSSVYESF